MLAGLAPPLAGAVELHPPTATVGYLAQEPDFAAGETVGAFLARRTGVDAAQRALDDATTALTEGRAGADDAYADALERWLALGGADLDARAGEVLADLGFAPELDRPTTALSGGQAARLGLAALLLSRYDVLLLDEPTNNLDLDGLARLEQYVTATPAAVVLVSHDRAFLDRVIDTVLELDPVERTARRYGGGYAAYLDEREVARRHAREAYEEYRETRDDLQERARTVRNWADKGVRNARKKQRDNDKIGRSKRIEASEQQAGKARRLDRAVERLEAVDEPRKVWELRYEITSAPRGGRLVAALDDAVVERGTFRLGPVTLVVEWADRVAVTGPNGAGKTTLIDALLGRATLASGTARLGPSVVVGEVDQARATFLGDEPLVDAFAAAVPELTRPDVRTLLAKFGLGADDVSRPASTLSPGERTRAALALFQARGVNFLVLDEPTNHLDLPAIEQLEAALDRFDGTVLLVTHDRALLDHVRVTRRLHVEDGQVTESA